MTRPLRRLRSSVLVAVLACVVGTACDPAPAPPPPLASRAIGVRFGPTPESLAEYEAWLGRPVDSVLLYFDGDTTADVGAHARHLAAQWKGTRVGTVVFSVPLTLPGQTLGQVASGSNDRMFRAIARALVANGHSDEVLRVGWEFNLESSRWSAVGRWRQYVSAFRRAVSTLRSVPGAERLKIEWNVARGGLAVPDEAYPGDEFVDVIGMDVYDRTSTAALGDPVARWQDFVTGQPGLDWLAAMGAAHGKPVAFSEWAVSSRHVSGVDPDNPYFVEQMRSWIDTHDVAYAMYFERDVDGLHRLMVNFPRASQRYRELFGTP